MDDVKSNMSSLYSTLKPFGTGLRMRVSMTLIYRGLIGR